MAVERQSALPPAQPSYIFRGHAAQIHSVQIVHQNRRLLTGDADGWIVYWKLESKRPVAVWSAHHAAILGTAEWGLDSIITHGRDNALRIWQIRAADENYLSTALPADGLTAHRPKPWLLHSLAVNTLNFCAFSMCHEEPAFNIERGDGNGLVQGHASPVRLSDPILVAVPSRDDKKIEVYRFPDEKLAYVVPRVQPTDTGMVMAVKLIQRQPSNGAIVIAGYEGGFTAVHLLGPSARSNTQMGGSVMPEFAQTIYLSHPHTQPILSIDILPDAKMYFTSSADAVITAHRIPDTPLNIPDKKAISIETPYKAVNTKHAGQQSLCVRSDGRLLVTGGWDSRIRVYSTKTLKELAVLKWHNQGVYAVDFGQILDRPNFGSSANNASLDEPLNDGQSSQPTSHGLQKVTGLGRLQQQREEQIQMRHWIAAGAKDGKVSLWEVF
ncbi:WD40 repeat-like protein [Lojkania enalia]|uniref:ASTRA-associated protein 1 n=1 Tax=Lojkania enalia TaxID=147567 RepID=A0A9P4N4K4_9PLEO|nr:WD40 repeat-like protein [Didymosphaeria enalia]